MASCEPVTFDVDDGFFTARWDRTTASEQQYRRPVAEIGGDAASISEVAARLGKKPNAFGPIRESLIKKGIIFASKRGVVAFTVPDVDSFIYRRVEG